MLMMFFACFVTCLKVFEENTTHGSHSNTVIKKTYNSIIFTKWNGKWKFM